MKRALSGRQAAACEYADGGRCRCRCGGAAHGAKRGSLGALPEGDPHKPEPRRRRRRRRGPVQQMELPIGGESRIDR